MKKIIFLVAIAGAATLLAAYSYATNQNRYAQPERNYTNTDDDDVQMQRGYYSNRINNENQAQQAQQLETRATSSI